MISEIHITFKLKDDTELNRLKEFCKENSIKLITLAYKTSLGSYKIDTMTSIIYREELSVEQLLNEYVYLFENNGFEIVRKKIETNLDNELKALYFESHIFCVKHYFSDFFNLVKFTNSVGGLISYNLEKEDNSFIITHKYSNITEQKFLKLLNHTLDDFTKNDYIIKKVQKEKVIFDSNMYYDNGWIN